MELNRREVVGALLAAGVGLLSAPAVAQDYRVNLLRVAKPWAAPTRPGVRSADVYMLIENKNTQIDRLVTVRTPVAERVSFVDEEPARGIMELVAYIDLRALRETALRPGRVHIRLEGLKQPLVKGRAFPMTLVFGSGATLDIQVDVDER
jgi:copper(I)-binding protein